MINDYPIKQTRYDSKGVEVVQLNTAFGEQIVAQVHPQFQQSFEYTVSNTELNTIITSGTATVTQASAMAVIGTGTTAGSEGLFKSTHHAKYKAGLGGLLRFTALFSSGVANTWQLAGLADEHGSTAEFKNGFMIGFNGANPTICRFQNDALFEVARTSWDDKLDGTGKSGVALDFTKLNVFYIQFQYLGGGNIYFWIEHPDTGIPFKFHTLKYANLFTSPSVHNPNFHITFYVDNLATTSNIVLKTSSYGYFIEGITELIEIHQPQFTSGTKSKTTVTSEVAIFTVKAKSTYPTASPKTNYIDALVEYFGSSIEASAANNLGTVRLVKNATLGGAPSYSDIHATDSIMEIDTSGTTVTGGVELLSVELAGKNDKAANNLIPYKHIIHPGETVTVAGSSANSATIKSSLLWKELF